MYPIITEEFCMNAKEGDKCSVRNPANNEFVDCYMGEIDSSGNKVYLTTVDSDVDGYNDRPHNKEYKDFIKHVRKGYSAGMTRSELVEIIGSGAYSIS